MIGETASLIDLCPDIVATKASHSARGEAMQNGAGSDVSRGMGGHLCCQGTELAQI